MLTGEPFEVVEYSTPALVDLLVDKSGATRDTVEAKAHLSYFDGYFSHLGARTIVAENAYVDRDFLEDYAAYYSRCFADYSRRCTRLHFFSDPISKRRLTGLLTKGASSATVAKLQKGYLGFVVVKPLPETIIGRTCLKTYADDVSRRFPVLRTYNVSLFGIDLTVETLAFQEQDTAAAACATSALWSAFHGTGLLFQHPIPSPVAITQAGTSGVPDRDRAFPSHGLNIEQMADAIRSVGLEPYAVDVGDEEILKTTVLAYLRAGIPSILAVLLFNGGQSVGGHAVTVGGYHLGPLAQRHYNPMSGMASLAGRVDKFYVNDDQVGPFARMLFDGRPVTDSITGKNYPFSVSTGWGPTVRAVPMAVLVPLYNKIRIPFSAIQDAMVGFNELLKAMQMAGVATIPSDLEWDIQLTTVSRLKREIIDDARIDHRMRAQLLLKSWPRFIWRATAASSGTPLLDLFFDATDLEQGEFLLHAAEYDPRLGLDLRSFHAGLTGAQQKYLACSPVGKIIAWYR